MAALKKRGSFDDICRKHTKREQNLQIVIRQQASTAKRENACGIGRLFFLLMTLLVLVSACSPRRIAETLLVGNHFILTKDIAYSREKRGHLDVYQPRSAEQLAPVVIFFYGGEWQSGFKEQYRLLGNALTRRGLVVVVPDYRLYPDARFPAWVKDGAEAVAWTKNNIERFGGDTTQIFMVGHSAGAHTAALLALDEHYLRKAGVPPHSVKGVVSLAGPVDTTWTDPDVQALMGPPENWPTTYPVNHIKGTEPPLLLLHGAQDETVSSANSVQFAARVRKHGGCARSIVYSGLDHVGAVIALSVPWYSKAPVLEDLISFIQAPRRFNRCN